MKRIRHYNKEKFLFSVLSAVIVGMMAGFLVVQAFKFVRGLHISSKSLVGESIYDASNTASSENSTDEEGIEDPSVISDLTKVLDNKNQNIDGREVIESAKSALDKNKLGKISATSYIVTDLTDDMVLLEKDADHLYPLASVTKLVTAVMAKKLMDQNSQIEITKKALSVEGDTGKLRLGEKLKVGEILYPLLMVSSNDAAEAIAQAYGRKKFIDEMNAWVNSIGAYRTYFRDPSGLSPQNLSTSRDITIIAKWIEKNMPEIFEITGTKTKTIRVHTWVNATHFLNLSAYVGGKNGYTPEADRTGIALFRLGAGNKLYSVVLLGSSQRDEDTLDILDLALK